MKQSKPPVIWSLLLLLPLTGAVMLPLLWSSRTSIVAGRTDFSDLYAAAYVVKSGEGRLLYDDDAQTAVKSRLFPEGRTTRSHNHLAFEALCLVPLAFLPYPAAVITWLVMSLALLVFVSLLLEPYVPRLRALLGVPLLAPCLGFYPIGQTLLEGQDSIVLLALYAAAFACLRSNRPYMAGVALACGLFKFHLVLPTILLLFLYRERKAVIGFLSAGSIVAAISVLVAGISGITQFARNLLAANSALTDSENQMRFALHPTAYSNIRGLVYWAFGSQASDMGLLIIVSGVSIAVLVVAGLLYHRVPLDLQFPFAIVVTTLLSFHLYYHDASMMLIPMFVAAEAALEGRCNGKVLTVVFTILMLTPIYPLSYLYNFASLMAIPMGAVGVCLALGLRAERTKANPMRAAAGAR